MLEVFQNLDTKLEMDESCKVKEMNLKENQADNIAKVSDKIRIYSTIDDLN